MVMHLSQPIFWSQSFLIEEHMRIRILVGLGFMCAGQLTAQDSTSASPVRSSATESTFRDPTTAAVLGTMFPGAGHVYSTEYVRGIQIYLGTDASIGGGVLVYVLDKCGFASFDTTCNPGPQWPHRTVGVLMIGAGIAIWAYGAIDAPRAARRANEMHRRKAQIRPHLEPGLSNGIDLGVAVSW
jgi:hypothetical protein